MFKKASLILGLAAASLYAYADEGMWLFNNFPKDKLQKSLNVKVDDKWLEHVQLSSARLAGGCSASFVSPDGLVMTNHHCAHDCIQNISTKEKNYVESGYYAKTSADEVACPDTEVNKLLSITDVTERVAKASKGLGDKEANKAQKQEITKIEKECQTDDTLLCSVVNLYHGGKYDLYKYKRFQDVRLVFAPEFAIAFFGGDPDNFMFPRYDLDVSFLRVYENGKPAAIDHYFKWSPAGVKEGDVTFVSGNPGSTRRLLTVAELEYERDVTLPNRLLRLAEYRGLLTEYMTKGAEQKRVADTSFFGVENSYKALKGRFNTLLDKASFEKKRQEEKELREKIAANPEWQKLYGSAWDEIAKALEMQKKMRLERAYLEGGSGFNSELFGIAKTVVRAADELPKANTDRLPEYSDARLPSLKESLYSKAPIDDDFEILNLTFSLTKLREDLGADHPFVKKVLGKESPAEMATRLIKNSKLKDIDTRKKLFEGGKKEVSASSDPLIKLAMLVDADGRTIRKQYEDTIEPTLRKNTELVAKARFAVYGTSIYPDATFSPRLSYGVVKGYEENGKKVAPITNLAGAFDRHTGSDPFKLPESWMSNKSKLNLKTPFNFVSTNDIIGGNSGSPVINKNAEIVGLIFDGNIQSLGGDYFFDESVNRAVSVHSEALIYTLDKIYGAARIVKELRGGK